MRTKAKEILKKIVLDLEDAARHKNDFDSIQYVYKRGKNGNIKETWCILFYKNKQFRIGCAKTNKDEKLVLKYKGRLIALKRAIAGCIYNSTALNTPILNGDLRGFESGCISVNDVSSKHMHIWFKVPTKVIKVINNIKENKHEHYC